MRVVPIVCFVLATAVVGSVLPVVSSYAQTFPPEVQYCASGGSSEGSGGCMQNRSDKLTAHSTHERSSPARHSRSGGHHR